MPALDILVPPALCQYADGQCDQDFAGLKQATQTFFIYPSAPAQIAATIETAAQDLSSLGSIGTFKTWKQLHIGGKTIFCEICKAMRQGSCIVADVTTLSFNLMFEIGFSIGLQLPVIPIRDSTYIRDKREFDELGIFDTLGYVDFQNSAELKDSLQKQLPGKHLSAPPTKIFQEQPLYIIKGRIETEGAVRMMSLFKKSALRFRTYDPDEVPRLSLHEARKQVPDRGRMYAR